MTPGTRTLGRTGVVVSRLCFGTLPLGPLQRNLPPEQAAELLAAAFFRGVTFLDTAQYYRNYPHILAGLRRFGGPVAVASKTYAHTAALAYAAVEEARRGLQRDVIDVFLLHEQEGEHTLRGHREALEELYRLKALGVLRAVGLSTHHVAGVYAAARWGLDVVHPLYNLTGLGIPDGTAADMGAAIARAHDAGLGVYSMKALAGGHLFAQSGAALRFVLDNPHIDSVAVGMQRAAEVECNAEFFRTGRFLYTAALRAERKLFIEEHCTGCGACVGRCPTRALTLEGGRAVCAHGSCVLCGYCAGVCPDFCLKIL
jgi:aryl-alcohol dehydrogenase-like predicted oxidoreductase